MIKITKDINIISINNFYNDSIESIRRVIKKRGFFIYCEDEKKKKNYICL